MTTLHFDADTGDGFRDSEFSKDSRLEPQITIGLHTDAAGLPLMVNAFEGNTADTATMLLVTGWNCKMRLCRDLESDAMSLTTSYM